MLLCTKGLRHNNAGISSWAAFFRWIQDKIDVNGKHCAMLMPAFNWGLL